MYDISDLTSKWIAGFLTGRAQEVVVNSTASSIGKVSFGVPQGTVLGPLLFLMYINDIGKTLFKRLLEKVFQIKKRCAPPTKRPFQITTMGHHLSDGF